MSRSLAIAVDAALAAGNVTYAILIELAFDSGTVYMCQETYNITWNGHTYLGVAQVGTIEPVQEAGELESLGMKGTLFCSPTSLGYALNEEVQGRGCTMRLALMDSSHQIIPDPIVCFVGRMDTMDVELGDTASITLTAESRFAAWNVPNVRRWNHEDQTSEHPSDRFFEFVPQMVEHQILWGVPGAVNQPIIPVPHA